MTVVFDKTREPLVVYDGQIEQSLLALEDLRSPNGGPYSQTTRVSCLIDYSSPEDTGKARSISTRFVLSLNNTIAVYTSKIFMFSSFSHLVLRTSACCFGSSGFVVGP